MSKPQIRLAPVRTNGKGGYLNIPGTYRICENIKCPRLIPCPHVKCQEHRTDFAVKDSVVPHFEPDEVEIVS